MDTFQLAFWINFVDFWDLLYFLLSDLLNITTFWADFLDLSCGFFWTCIFIQIKDIKTFLQNCELDICIWFHHFWLFSHQSCQHISDRNTEPDMDPTDSSYVTTLDFWTIHLEKENGIVSLPSPCLYTSQLKLPKKPQSSCNWEVRDYHLMNVTVARKGDTAFTVAKLDISVSSVLRFQETLHPVQSGEVCDANFQNLSPNWNWSASSGHTLLG